jgi:hypothetical protein
MCLTITNKEYSESIRQKIESLPNKRIRVYKQLKYVAKTKSFQAPVMNTGFKLDKNGFLKSNTNSTAVTYKKSYYYPYRDEANVSQGIHCYRTKYHWQGPMLNGWGYAEDYIGGEGDHVVFTKIKIDKSDLKRYVNQMTKYHAPKPQQVAKLAVSDTKWEIRDSISRINRAKKTIQRETERLKNRKLKLKEAEKKLKTIKTPQIVSINIDKFYAKN